MTPFYQYLNVGKVPHSVGRFHLSDKSPHFASTWMLVIQPILSDVFTCPTNHPISPTFACWLIWLFYQCFNLSHKWPRFANICMLVNSAVCGTFLVIPVFGQIGQHFHKWLFTLCSNLWWFHQIRSSKPNTNFHTTFNLLQQLLFSLKSQLTLAHYQLPW